jgi:cell wall-associated NlpC family hydrolase
MTALDVHLPRTAAQQERTGQSVPKALDELRPGDLVTFGKRGKRTSHIGIYVGNNRFVHASSLAGKVIESELVRPGSRRTKAWRSVRRLVVTPDSTTLNTLLLNNAALGVRS